MRSLWALILIFHVVTFLNAAQEAPPKRPPAEIKAALGEPKPLPNARAIKLTLVASKQDHGPGEHDYPVWQTNWTGLLPKSKGVQIATAWNWPSPEQFKDTDAFLFYFWNHDWTADQYDQLDAFLERGGGVVILHSASIADKQPEDLAKRIGLAFQPGRSKFRHGALDLKLTANSDHPILRGLPRTMHFVDETYWPMIGDPKDVEILAIADEEGKSWPMLWTVQKGKGRIFVSILGHYSWTYDDPFFRALTLRGLAWTLSEPTTRFDHLALE
jgi:type 1 glutamine amidotransferase